MSHDTHGAAHTDNPVRVPSRNALFLVIILVGLFIAAIDFVKVVSNASDEGADGVKTEAGMNGK